MPVTAVKKWKLIWSFKNPTPVFHVSYSPDERFFVTLSKYDRLAKIWYKSCEKDQKESYSYLYLPHPRAVLSAEWRRRIRLDM